MNYQKQLEEVIKQEKNNRKKLLIHSCCAPCSSYVLEYLREYFDITVFFYNPNISNAVEYEKRLQEEKRLIEAYNKQVESGNFENMNSTENASIIKILDIGYEPSEFFEAVKGYEQCKEGGERCYKCFELRLGKTYVNPASHGEGRFVAPKEWIDKLFANGQVATQYADINGNISMDEEWNINGSYASIEGITSPDGRCFGKMAHSERRDASVAMNIYGEQDMKIFESGVKYFK